MLILLFKMLNIINHYLKEDSSLIESILEKGTSLIIQLRDRKRQLIIVIEEHVLSLITEFKKLWGNHQQILDKINHYSNVSEEHINEARMQDESVQEITDRVLNTFSFLESKIAQMDFSSVIRMKSPSGKVFLFFFNLKIINHSLIEGDHFSEDDKYSIEFQSLLEEETSLINQLRDHMRELNILVEEYGNSLTGNEENVLNLVTKVKELWENLKKLLDKMTYYSSISEEQKQEANKVQESIERDLKEDLFATLFNAKYIHLRK